jgi:hypothetical protein
MVRIYLREADHGRRRALADEILKLLRETHAVAHVTIFRGVAGSDEHGETHFADALRSFVNLPEAVEFYDAPERVEAALASLASLVPPGRTVVWDAVLR